MTKSAYFDLQDREAEIPAGCPVGHGFSPFSDAYVADPYRVLAAQRAETPVFYAPDLGYLVLTRMADVAEVLRRSDEFSSENVQRPVSPVCAAAQAVLAADEFNPVPVSDGFRVAPSARRSAARGTVAAGCGSWVFGATLAAERLAYRLCSIGTTSPPCPFTIPISAAPARSVARFTGSAARWL